MARILTVSQPHAILGCDRQVIAIRSYPRSTKSYAVIPIPDHTPVKIGWLWTGSQFIPPTPPEEF